MDSEAGNADDSLCRHVSSGDLSDVRTMSDLRPMEDSRRRSLFRPL
jgi:hypothetical protein